MNKAKKAKIMKGAEIGGVVTAALLAASAGAYLLSDKKNQAKMKSWAKKARVEVAKKAKVAKRLGESQYKTIVDEVVKRYGPLEDVSARDLIAVGKELKAQWGAIQKSAQKLAKTKTAPKKAAHHRRPTAAKKPTKRKTARKAK